MKFSKVKEAVGIEKIEEITLNVDDEDTKLKVNIAYGPVLAGKLTAYGEKVKEAAALDIAATEYEKANEAADDLLRVFSKFLTEWDITDEELNPIPISFENFKELGIDEMFTFIINVLNTMKTENLEKTGSVPSNTSTKPVRKPRTRK